MPVPELQFRRQLDEVSAGLQQASDLTFESQLQGLFRDSGAPRLDEAARQRALEGVSPEEVFGRDGRFLCAAFLGILATHAFPGSVDLSGAQEIQRRRYGWRRLAFGKEYLDRTLLERRAYPIGVVAAGAGEQVLGADPNVAYLCEDGLIRTGYLAQKRGAFRGALRRGEDGVPEQFVTGTFRTARIPVPVGGLLSRKTEQQDRTVFTPQSLRDTLVAIGEREERRLLRREQPVWSRLRSRGSRT